jgi:hypothetical protein
MDTENFSRFSVTSNLMVYAWNIKYKSISIPNNKEVKFQPFFWSEFFLVCLLIRMERLDPDLGGDLSPHDTR